ncbi:DUF2490 domain-containing protein [Hymenobacter gummosus]|uniref:DUF2490 domain-containing protein n=1 Tax=Hymenobacter gummosus TaxID=1776032 RepID=A0A431U222_9BACT|nr:DUF2490 domain-containing protein [Hymenobacter gummosus]RTQ49254.1 DUF2490 domain-containing protein [Hymenobacter gummosus]
MPLFSRLIGALLLLGAVQPAFAQTTEGRVADNNRHLWLVYNGSFRLSEHWGLYTEAQLRRADQGRKPQQTLVRGAVDYHVCPKLMLSTGYAYQKSFPYGDFPASSNSPEHRLYEQILLRDEAGPVQLQHRYRLEQRWIHWPGDLDYTYQNRARYLLRLTLPLFGPKIEPRMPYLAASDEVMINFGRRVRNNIFDQNRLYAGFGYAASKFVNLEAGYLNQLVQQRNGRVFEHNHTLQLSVILNVDLRRDHTPPLEPAPAVD